MKRIFLFFALCICFSPAFAQSNNVEMADALRGSGKIYVVVGVILVLFIGIVIYLFSIDRRLKKIENQK